MITTTSSSSISFSSREGGKPASLTVETAASPPDTSAPTVPSGVAAVATSSTSVSVSWAASSDDTAVAGYEVLRDGVQVASVAASLLSYADTALSPSTGYSYAVRAIDAAANRSAASDPVSVTTPAPPDTSAPTVPSGVVAVATSSTSVSVSWAASSDDTAVAGYEVLRDGVQVASVAASLLSYTDTALSPSTGYSYAVRAIDAAANRSAASDPVSVTTPAPPDTSAPTVPSGVVAVATSSTSVSVSWAASSDDTAVAGYEVLRDGVQVASVAASSLSYTDTALSPSTGYSYAVRAIDAAANRSAASDPVSVTTAAIVVLAAVADAQVQADVPGSNFGTAKSLRVDGSPVTRSFLRFDVTGLTGAITKATLRVWRLNTASHSGFAVHAVANTTWGETAVTWNSQPAFTATATATTGPVAAGPSYVDLDVTTLVTGQGLRSLMLDTASSTSISIDSREGSHKPTLLLQTLADRTAPTVPAGLTAVATSATSATVSWAASFDAVGVAVYEVYRGATLAGSVAAPGTSLSNEGLTAGSTYTFSVRARDAAGNVSDLSAGVPVTLLDTSMPGIPADVAAVAASPSSVTVSWSASTDNWAVTAYNVYRGGTLAGTVNAPGLSFTDGGRAASTTYTYTVRARDAAGNVSGDSTPPASATTPASGPATMTLEPVADAYVQDRLTTNTGISTQLRVDASPTTRAYLKFTVSGLSAPPAKVELRVYATNTSAYAAGYRAFGVAISTWTETGITYANAPALDAVAVGSTGALPAAVGYRTIVVTPLITGNGTYSIALTTTSTTALALASRQSTNRPQLVITT